MGCNCKKKNQVINNLDKPSYVQQAIDLWNEIKNIPVNELDDLHWSQMFGVYNTIYPNSNGQPSREELPGIIEKITHYKK